jgi:hypothetical protein
MVTVYIPSDTDETESSEEQDEGAMTTDTSDKKMIEKTLQLLSLQ